MPSKYARIDKLIAQTLQVSKKSVRQLVAAKRIFLNDTLCERVDTIIGPFDKVQVDEKVLPYHTAQYWMLHKPAGVVSATKDSEHTTAVSLLPPSASTNLHIAGRLDLNSTGLLLLTNDGRWSKALSDASNQVTKRYQVELKEPLDERYVEAFHKGMYFSYEDMTTAPAELIILSTHRAEVILTEGRYHQIKRMFGRFRNQVISLHRSEIGNLALCPSLAQGQSRALREDELQQLSHLLK
ncbi:MAG: pseudouridine synthase [Pseudomonadales bacterium]